MIYRGQQLNNSTAKYFYLAEKLNWIILSIQAEIPLFIKTEHFTYISSIRGKVMPMDYFRKGQKQSAPMLYSMVYFYLWCLTLIANDTELSRPAIPLFTCLSSGEGKFEYTGCYSIKHRSQKRRHSHLDQGAGGKCFPLWWKLGRACHFQLQCRPKLLV